jgi:hypothetical protein
VVRKQHPLFTNISQEPTGSTQVWSNNWFLSFTECNCVQTLGTSSTYQNKNVHINMWPETFNLWVVAERILCRHQQQFSINVWAGIVGDCLAGILHNDAVSTTKVIQLRMIWKCEEARRWKDYDWRAASCFPRRTQLHRVG